MDIKSIATLKAIKDSALKQIADGAMDLKTKRQKKMDELAAKGISGGRYQEAMDTIFAEKNAFSALALAAEKLEKIIEG